MVAIEPHYCHQCGAALSERSVDGRARAYCPACDRLYFRNAVVSVQIIVHDGEDVLVLDQAANPGVRSLPGGHPEHDEEPRVAAARELEEETGLRADPATLSLCSVVHSPHQGLDYNMVTYAVPRAETTGEPAPGDEARAVAFWSTTRLLSSSAETREIDRERVAAWRAERA